MVPPNIPSNLPNLVTPFLPAGPRPTGQASVDHRSVTFKPVEQPADSAKSRLELRNKRQEQDQQPGSGTEGESAGNNTAEQRDTGSGRDDKAARPTQDEPLELYTAPHSQRRYSPPPPGSLLDESV